MALTRLFWTVDTAIGRLPHLLAQLAAGLLITVFVVAYTWLATVDWAHRTRPDQQGRP